MFLGRSKENFVIRKKHAPKISPTRSLRVSFKNVSLRSNFFTMSTHTLQPHSVAMGGNGCLIQYNINKKEQTLLLKKFDSIRSVNFTSISHRKDGKVLICGTTSQRLYLFSTESFKKPLKSYPASKRASPVRITKFLNNSAIFSGCDNGLVFFKDVISGNHLKSFKTNDSVRAGGVIDENVCVVGNYGGNVYQCHVNEKKDKLLLKETEPIERMVVNNNEIILGVGRSIKIWDRRNLKERVYQRTVHRRTITGLFYEREKVSSTSLDGFCSVWEYKKNKITDNWNIGKPIFDLCISPKSTFLLCNRKLVYTEMEEDETALSEKIIRKKRRLNKVEVFEILEKNVKTEFSMEILLDMKDRNELDILIDSLNNDKLYILLKFIHDNVDNQKYTRFLSNLMLRIMKFYAKIIGRDETIDNMFRRIRKRINMMIATQKKLINMGAIIETTILVPMM